MIVNIHDNGNVIITGTVDELDNLADAIEDALEDGEARRPWLTETGVAEFFVKVTE